LLQGTTDNYQPLAILGTRTVNKLSTEILEVLVHWQGKLSEETTGEDLSLLDIQMQTFSFSTEC